MEDRNFSVSPDKKCMYLDACFDAPYYLLETRYFCEILAQLMLVNEGESRRYKGLKAWIQWRIK